MKRSLNLLFAAVALLVASPLYAQLYVPEIPYDSAPDLIKGMPNDLYLGEAVGVERRIAATDVFGHCCLKPPRKSMENARAFDKKTCLRRNVCRLHSKKIDFIEGPGRGQ